MHSFDKMLTDFRNSFTELSNKFAEKKLVIRQTQR